MIRQRIGFFTYNRLPGITNGWHTGINGRRAFVVASTNDDNPEAHNIWGPESQFIVAREIAKLWPQFESELPRLDHYVFYLGGPGSQSVIVKAVGIIEPPKTMFLMCTCGLFTKLFVLGIADFIRIQSGCHQMLCECGGQDSMTRLIRSFLEKRIWLPGH